MYRRYSASVLGILFVIGCGGNHPPTTPIITATAYTVFSESQVFLNATATDPDGDYLSWEWDAEAGTFAGPYYPYTIWTAPEVSDTQQIKIRVQVSDTPGEKASAEIVITVLPRPEPGQEVVVGDKTEEYFVPFDGDKYDYFRYQVLYTAEEIGMEGKIIKLSIMPSITSSAIFNNLTIYAARVSRNQLESSFNDNYEGTSGSVVLYSPSFTISALQDSWFDLPLSSFFEYDTSANLLLEFSWRLDDENTVKCYGTKTTPVMRSLESEFEDAVDGLLKDRVLYLKLTFAHQP